MDLEQVDAYYMKGKSHDCGSKLGYMTANVEYAMRHPELGDEFKAFIKDIKL
jgi:UTP--glucose-1-phosphate uridylyltransferase